MDKYKDIIDLPHHESKNHTRMSMSIRASIFSPFSALVGYEDAVKETARIVDEKIILDEEVKNRINTQLQKILKNIKDKPKVIITYFIKDKNKNGGKYITTTKNIEKINLTEKYIMLNNKEKINFKDIKSININE